MMIIDAHAHAWLPEDLVSLGKSAVLLDGMENVDSPYNWSPRFEGTLKALLRAEEKAGVDRVVVLPVSSRPERCPDLSRWLAREAEFDPRLLPFGSVHPYSSSIKDDVALIKDLGLQGVKLHSLVQHFSPLGPDAQRAYGLIERAGLPLVMDSMSLDGAMNVKPNLRPLMELAREHEIETGPDQITAITGMFPGLKIVAAHLGHLYGWDRLDSLYELDQVYFDLAYVHRLMTPEQAERIIRAKGPDRIIFGTDAPYRHPKKALDWFFRLNLKPEEQEKILALNFLNLIGEN